MKSIVSTSTIFLLAGTFVPSLVAETGGHRSLRGSEHTVRLNEIVGEGNGWADCDTRAVVFR